MDCNNMSVVVAVCKNDKVAIAADTMHLTGSRREHADNLVRASKLRRIGRSVLGGVGWSVYDNIIDHYLRRNRNRPSLKDEDAIFDFFLKLWRHMREKYQLVNDQPDKDSRSPFADIDSQFIVASRTTIHAINSELAVSRYARFVVIGSGSHYAYGALHALYDSRRSAAQLATAAVRAAVHFDDSCGGVPEVISLS